jgi:hypothetical protein
MYEKVNKIDTFDKKQLLYFLMLNSRKIPPFLHTSPGKVMTDPNS